MTVCRSFIPGSYTYLMLLVCFCHNTETNSAYLYSYTYLMLFVCFCHDTETNSAYLYYSMAGMPISYKLSRYNSSPK